MYMYTIFFDQEEREEAKRMYLSKEVLKSLLICKRYPNTQCSFFDSSEQFQYTGKHTTNTYLLVHIHVPFKFD